MTAAGCDPTEGCRLVFHPATGEPPAGRRRLEPVRLGLPWPRGRLEGTAAGIVLQDEAGRRRPLQTRALDRWPDGSVRWALLDFQYDGDDDGAWTVRLPSRPLPAAPSSPLAADLSPAGDRLEVDTGAARFSLSVGGSFPFDRVEIDGRAALDPQRSRLRVVDGHDRSYHAQLLGLEVEEQGPVRVVALARARLIGAAPELLAELTARFHFFARSTTLRVDLTLLNPRKAGHRGGLWSLGAPGSIYLRDLALILTLPPGSGRTRIECSPETGGRLEPHESPLVLFQASSGGRNWSCRNHLDRHGRLPLRFPGYRLYTATLHRAGRRATPIVSVAREDGGYLAVAMEHFWQNFPKAVEADADALALRLFPHHQGSEHEIQGGEQKTHSFHLAFAPDQVAEIPLDWCRTPLLPRASPAWYAGSGAIAQLLPAAEDPNHGYRRLVGVALAGDDTFALKRETIDEFGWRNFGDLYADHEAVFHRGSSPLVSHYNNQYDAVRGFAVQFVRSSDPRWHRLMDDLARHVIDIDLYHTGRDKSAYNHGQFWHTVHYTDAGTSNHRSYPRVPGVGGGGPSSGNLYTSGLLLHHLLTGCQSSREAVLQLGQYVLDADDGTKTVFRFLDRGDTGHVSSSGVDDYHGPGRTPANAINGLLDAHRLSGAQRFLAKAEQLIRRCVHPADDIEARNLLDAENRWYYLMFLQTLGKYLAYKAERGQLDAGYAYARQALLAYAAWAAERESPFLDRAEQLEYPTETWAAQDMRKSEVFKIAALHSAGAARERFVERARYFFDQSVAQLTRMPTRSLCRPVVLLLSHGYAQAYFDRHPQAAAPPGPTLPGGFGSPRPFVPQKRRAKRRLLLLTGLAVLVLAGLASAWLLRRG